jgi:hypothetical protein
MRSSAHRGCPAAPSTTSKAMRSALCRRQRYGILNGIARLWFLGKTLVPHSIKFIDYWTMDGFFEGSIFAGHGLPKLLPRLPQLLPANGHLIVRFSASPSESV